MFSRSIEQQCRMSRGGWFGYKKVDRNFASTSRYTESQPKHSTGWSKQNFGLDFYYPPLSVFFLKTSTEM